MTHPLPADQTFTIRLGYRPHRHVALLKCRAAIAGLEPYERDWVLVRLAHPDPEDEKEPGLETHTMRSNR